MNKRVQKLANVEYGASPAGVMDSDGNTPVVGTGGVYGYASRALFPGPAVVVPRKGSLGNPQLLTQPFWPSDTTFAVLPKTGVDAAWLYYNFCRYDLTRLNEATGVPSIGRECLYRVEFSDPGPDVQIKISDMLRSADRRIDIAEELIAKHQRTKTGLMHDLLTRGLDESGQLRPPRAEAPELYKESPLGWIPIEWVVSETNSLLSKIILAVMSGIPSGVLLGVFPL